MKKLTLLTLLISSILFVNCENTNENEGVQEKMDLSNIKLEGILDFNTKISKSSLKNEKSTEKILFLIEESKSIAKKEGSEFIKLKFYFKDDFLYVRNEMADLTHQDDNDDELNEGGADSGGMDCNGWKHCKNCTSQDCVVEFIKEMADKYDCFITKVDRKTFSAKVYGKPCGN